MSNINICDGLLQNNEKNIGIFTLDFDFKVTSWSKGCENIFGFKQEFMTNKSIFETIVPEYSKDGLMSDLKNKKDLDFHQVEFILKDKSTNFFNTTVRYDNKITVLLFTSKQEPKQKLTNLINDNLTHDIIITLDKNGYIKEFNQEASFLTGYSKDEVKERNFVELFIPASYQEKILLQIQSTFKKKELRVRDNYPIICKDGSKKIVYWDYSLHTHSHREKRLFLTSHNQTKESIITQKLDYLASYDNLTDLPNKNLFLKKLQNSIDKVSKSAAKFPFE